MEGFYRMTLRIPIELADWMRIAAKENYRSLNGQIVEVLKEQKAQKEGQKNAAQ